MGKIGRPKQFGDPVSIRLPLPLHDALIREARLKRLDVSELIRKFLTDRVSYSKTSHPADSHVA